MTQKLHDSQDQIYQSIAFAVIGTQQEFTQALSEQMKAITGSFMRQLANGLRRQIILHTMQGSADS